jgi:hypothetical protein
LNIDPSKRPNLHTIIVSDFFTFGISIPKLLPTCTLNSAPSLLYMKKFIPDADYNGIVHRQSNTIKMGELRDSLSNLVMTDRDESKPFLSINQLITNSERHDIIENMGSGRAFTTNDIKNNLGKKFNKI